MRHTKYSWGEGLFYLATDAQQPPVVKRRFLPSLQGRFYICFVPLNGFSGILPIDPSARTTSKSSQLPQSSFSLREL